MATPQNQLENARRWREKNREKANASYKKYHATDEAELVRRNTYYLKTYGISLDQYNEVLEEQNYVCKICHCPEISKTQRKSRKYKYLAVDHCHTTGKVRGLLCNSCNVLLARSYDSISILQKAITYLKENQ